MKNREKTLVIVVVVLLVAMGMKSLYFDPFKPQSLEEEELKVEMTRIIEAEHDNVFYDMGILTTRIIAVKETEGVLKGHNLKNALGLFLLGEEY